jgi:aminopeptidase N
LEKGGLADLFNKHHTTTDKLWLWDFGDCPKISSYIYNLCAGDFTMIPNTRDDSPTPMRIFVRKTKADFVNADLVFRVLT